MSDVQADRTVVPAIRRLISGGDATAGGGAGAYQRLIDEP